MALNTLKSKIKYRISRSKGSVVTPRDFFDLSDRDQVSRVLRQLVCDEILIKFGRGLYAKTKRSSVTDRIIPAKPLTELATEALVNKLNVQVLVAEDKALYNSDESSQVPTGRVIAVKGRVSRKMAYNGKSIKYRYVS